MDAEDELTHAVAVLLTDAEARWLRSFAGMLGDDPDCLRAVWTWHPDHEISRQIERELDEDPDETRAVLAAASSGFRKLTAALSERLGPDVSLGPRRLADRPKKGDDRR